MFFLKMRTKKQTRTKKKKKGKKALIRERESITLSKISQDVLNPKITLKGLEECRENLEKQTWMDKKGS